jgi:hypothetical protein
MKATKATANREWVVFTEDKGRHVVSAPSLRTALRNFDKSKARIVAAIEMGCLPVQPAEDRPFIAVLLANPHFVVHDL